MRLLEGFPLGGEVGDCGEGHDEAAVFLVGLDDRREGAPCSILKGLGARHVVRSRSNALIEHIGFRTSCRNKRGGWSRPSKWCDGASGVGGGPPPPRPFFFLGPLPLLPGA